MQTTFKTPCGCVVTREEALRALVAAVYDVAKVQALFTTDNVFAATQPFTSHGEALGTETTTYHNNNGAMYTPGDALRHATASSKLVSVALRKAAAQGYCEPSHANQWAGDPTCHRRRKTVWRSLITQV